VILRTHIAEGSPNKQDSSKAHGSPLGAEEVELTKKAYGWPTLEPFYIPDEALQHFREAVDRGAQFEEEWDERAATFEAAHPDLWHELKLVMEKRLPDGWNADWPRFQPDKEKPGGGAVATRKASHDVIQTAAVRVPQLVTGAADLYSSTLADIDDSPAVTRGHYEGRNINYGVREHAMGAIVNGLNLNGFRAFGSTFLQFTDYMKNTIRLAALMKLPSIFVYTHDSIGLGEDGPTHQPVEHLAGLRAIPGLYVLRPADANETALAWEFAIAQTEHPTLFALSRQGLPILDPDAVPADAIERGAYVLAEASGGTPEVILIATGSEVGLCVAARELLEGDGIGTRVVSMPCAERFVAQDEGYRDSVLPREVRARVAVEAASPLGWDRFVGEQGAIIGMNTFGASAPAKDVFAYFGFTPDNVAAKAREVRERIQA
jgi:transketolase